MDDLFANTKPPWFDRRAKTLLAIFAAYALFDVTQNLGGNGELQRTMLMGAWLSQPILLGVWAAIGPPPAVTRLPATIIAAVLLATISSIFGFEGNPRSSIVEPMFIMACIFVGASLVMRIMGHRKKWQITSDQAAATPATNQFSIKYLIGLTTAIALTLATVRLMVGSNSFGNTAGVNIKFFTRFMWVCAVILLGTLPIPTVPIVILSGRPTVKSLVLLLIAWAVATLAAAQIVITLDRVEWTRITGDLLGFQLGGTIMSALTATFVRKAGYRLTSRS